MGQVWWSTIGITFDMFGALFLSIEAVKVKNLQRAVDSAAQFVTHTFTRVQSAIFGLPPTIGISGALLLVSGFALQLVGVWS